MLVGWKNFNFLLEVKGEDGALTEYQVKFFDEWRGQADIIRTIADVKEILRRIMPVYVYRCEACGKFEYTQKFSDDPLSVCPTCEKEVKRIIQTVGVIYLVDGFTKKTEKPKHVGNDNVPH